MSFFVLVSENDWYVQTRIENLYREKGMRSVFRKLHEYQLKLQVPKTSHLLTNFVYGIGKNGFEWSCSIASEALRERKMKVRVYPWRQRQWRRSPLPSRCQKCHSLQSSDPCRPPSSAPRGARVSKMNSSCLNKLFRAEMFTAFCWKFQLRENS